MPYQLLKCQPTLINHRIHTLTLSQYYWETLEENNKMGFLNLMWNPKFIKTRAGMTMTAQCAVGFLGGFFALFCCVLNGFESFLLWGAFFGSGFFLFTHVANLTQVLEARFPYLVRIVSLLFWFQTLIWPSLWSAPWVYLPLVRSSGNHVHLEIGLWWRLSGDRRTISQHIPLHGSVSPLLGVWLDPSLCICIWFDVQVLQIQVRNLILEIWC